MVMVTRTSRIVGVDVRGRLVRSKLCEGTVQIAPGKVAKADPGGDWVRFTSASDLPRPGQSVVVNVSAADPKGVLGRVVCVSGTKATLEPVAFDEAYPQRSLASVGRGGSSGRGTRRCAWRGRQTTANARRRDCEGALPVTQSWW